MGKRANFVILLINSCYSVGPVNISDQKGPPHCSGAENIKEGIVSRMVTYAFKVWWPKCNFDSSPAKKYPHFIGQ